MQIIEATLPLKMDVIKQFYEQKESTFFKIDYLNSTLRSKELINYIGNLELECSLQLDGVDADEIASLLLHYMTSPLIVSCANLTTELLDILFLAKGVNFEVSSQPLLSEERRDQFISENASIVGSWVLFLDSLWVFACATIETAQTGKTLPECLTKAHYPIIRNREIVGRSVVNFFKIPSFFEAWFSVKPYKMAYFQYQFEERFTGNRLLYDFFAFQNNWLLMMVLHESEKRGLLTSEPPKEEA